MRTLLLLSIAFIVQLGHAQDATPNYALADRYSPNNLKKLVFSTSVDPHWLKESDRFWYSYETSEGKHWYIVDPTKGTKELLFDNVYIAAEMSRLTGDPFDAKHMDISKLKFIKNETVVQWEVKSKLVKVDEEDDEDDMEDEQDSKDKKKKKPKKVAKVWHFEYDLGTKVLSLIDDFEKTEEDEDWASISPDSSYVLFSKDYNLWWMDWENYLKAQEDDEDSTIVETQWTTDGEEHYQYGGFNRGKDNVEVEKEKDDRKSVSVTWSPSGQRFAMTRTDARNVKDLWVLKNTANPRPTLETYKYHMAGEKEAPSYEMYVFDFPSRSQTRIELDTFKDQSIAILRAPTKKTTRDDDMRWRYWARQMTASDCTSAGRAVI